MKHGMTIGIKVTSPLEEELMIISGGGNIYQQYNSLNGNASPYNTDPTDVANGLSGICFLVPKTGVLKNLYIACDAPGAGENVQFILFVDGTGYSLSVTISDTATSGSNSIDLHTVTAGLLCCILVVKSAGCATQQATFNIEFVPS